MVKEEEMRARYSEYRGPSEGPKVRNSPININVIFAPSLFYMCPRTSVHTLNLK